jgi:hypothetical protein
MAGNMAEDIDRPMLPSIHRNEAGSMAAESIAAGKSQA